MTSLASCVENNNSRILSLLVAVPGSVSHKELNAALTLAVKCGSTDCARILFPVCANNDEDFMFKSTSSLLVTAVSHGHVEMLDFLIQNGCDVNSPNMSLLHNAAKNGYHNLADRLIWAGAPIDDRDSSGDTPLIVAAKDPHKTISVIKTLLDAISKSGSTSVLDVQNNENKTALHYTAHKAIGFRPLLEAGANPNLQDRYGNTPMMLAATEGFDNVILTLLSFKANPDIKNHYEKAPLHFLAMKNHWEALVGIAESGGDVNIEDGSNRVPLWYAVNHNRPEAVKALLRANCRPDSTHVKQAHENPSPLQVAFQKQLYGIAKLLVLSGCELKPLYTWLNATEESHRAFHAEREERRRLLFADQVEEEEDGDSDEERQEEEEAISWFEGWVHTPHTLRQICRIYIRQLLRGQTTAVMDDLPLPPSVRDYVLLKEVEEHHIRGYLM